MDTLQSVVIIVATALLVLTFCSGTKAVCRKILAKLDMKNKRKAEEL